MGKHVCPWWFAYTFDNPLRRLLHNSEKIFNPYLKPGMTAIDVGCGMGYFSIGMAKLVGDSGKVISADLQQKMLDTLIKRAAKAGVASRISTVLCDEDNIRVSKEVDFALAFWMVHEVPDTFSLFSQIHAMLKQTGQLLFTEPKFHVSKSEYKRTLSIAYESGFKLIDNPSICCSYAALLQK